MRLVIMLTALAFLLIACATPEPVVERVEAPVTRLVDTVAAQTAEAPVTAAPSPVTLTPEPTPTPTPPPTATPTPTPRPTPVDLASATSANAWVHVRNRIYDWLDVYAATDSDWDRFAVTVLVDGEECDNYSELQVANRYSNSTAGAVMRCPTPPSKRFRCGPRLGR